MNQKPRQKRNTDWVEGYDFLITPQPQREELLSSWLTRVAFAHGMTLNQFFTLFIRHEGHALTRTDLDFQYRPEFYEVLVQKSKLDLTTIQSLSLRSEEGYLFTCNECLYPPKAIRKLVDKRTHYGLLFCPECLAEDEHPYFRQKWRYHFYNACPKHKIYLTDRCGKCYERVRFSKMAVNEKIVFCSKCSRDLRLTRPKKVPESCQYGLAAITWFEDGLRNGYFWINDTKVNSLWVFQVSTHLQYLLLRQKKLALFGFPMLQDYRQLCKKLELYHSTKCRAIYRDFFLTAMTYFLFQSPHHFQRFAKDNHLTYREFTHGFLHLPFWYQTMIYELIPMRNKTGREITEEEVLGAIKYLNELGVKITQAQVAYLVGCHSTIHTEFVNIFHKLKRIIQI